MGVSQEELAELCDLHRTYIGSVERGERNITLKTLKQIAVALNVKAESLIKDV
jgi:transcriptional regulator with XRE-family HTH domain